MRETQDVNTALWMMALEELMYLFRMARTPEDGDVLTSDEYCFYLDWWSALWSERRGR